MQQSQVALWRGMSLAQWKQKVANVWPKVTSLSAQLQSHDDLDLEKDTRVPNQKNNTLFMVFQPYLYVHWTATRYVDIKPAIYL